MTDIDTLRWGDSQTLSVPGGSIQQSVQIVQGRWQRPLAWKLLVVIIPQVAAGETGTFKATMNLSIGIGQGTVTVPIPFSIAPTAGVYSPVIQNLDIPAQEVQISFTVDATGATAEGDANAFTVSAFIAPFTEPRVLMDLRDALVDRAALASRALAEPDRDGLPRWMPPGFDDGMLRYR